MKTIIRITLSNEERSHLADLLDHKVTKRMVSREEITCVAKTLFRQELLRRYPNGSDQNSPDLGRGTSVPEPEVRGGSEGVPATSSGVSSSMAEDTPPAAGAERLIDAGGSDPACHEEVAKSSATAAGLTAACNKVLQHIALNQEDDCVCISYCSSILLATGIE